MRFLSRWPVLTMRKPHDQAGIERKPSLTTCAIKSPLGNDRAGDKKHLESKTDGQPTNQAKALRLIANKVTLYV